MTRDEKGYIQFRCEWEPADLPAGPLVEALIGWRDRHHVLGLIGVYPDGIGYGNVSVRVPGQNSFLISGTATGGLSTLTPGHVAEVTGFDIAGNALACRGRVKASSESLSHAAVYVADPTACAVIHVHHLGMWEHLFDRVPTTDPTAEAGTPEMAFAIADLFRTTAVRDGGLLVMGGHREGLMAFGRTPDEAGTRVTEAFARFAVTGRSAAGR